MGRKLNGTWLHCLVSFGVALDLLKWSICHVRKGSLLRSKIKAGPQWVHTERSYTVLILRFLLAKGVYTLGDLPE